MSDEHGYWTPPPNPTFREGEIDLGGFLDHSETLEEFLGGLVVGSLEVVGFYTDEDVAEAERRYRAAMKYLAEMN